MQDAAEEFSSESEKSLYIGSIPSTLTEKGLHNILSKFGSITSFIYREHFAIVEFAQKSDCFNAIEVLRRTNKYLVVRFARPRKPRVPVPVIDGVETQVEPEYSAVNIMEIPVAKSIGTRYGISQAQVAKRISDSCIRYRPPALLNVEDLEDAEPQPVDQKCYQCNKITDYFCKRCLTFFCSVQCQRDAAEKHMTFCNTLSKVGVDLDLKSLPSVVNSNANDNGNSSSKSGSETSDSGINSKHTYQKQFEKSKNTRPHTTSTSSLQGIPNSRFYSKPTPPAPNNLGFPSRFLFDTTEHKGKAKLTTSHCDARRQPNLSPSVVADESHHNNSNRRNSYLDPACPVKSVQNRTDSIILPSMASKISSEYNRQLSELESSYSKMICNDGKSVYVESQLKASSTPPLVQTEEKITLRSDKVQSPGTVAKEITLRPRSVADSATNASYPPSNSLIKVYLLYPENGGWWVLDKKRKKEYEVVRQELAERNMSDLPRYLAANDCVCAAPYEGLWYRVRIMTTVPCIMVHYIDYGNTSRIEPENLRTLPSNLEEISDLVFYIKFAPGTSIDYSDERLQNQCISVQVIGFEGDAKIVEMVDDDFSDVQVETERVASQPDNTPTVKKASNIAHGRDKKLLQCSETSAEERFPSGSTVVIAYVHNVTCVSITNTANEEAYSLLANEVVLACAKGSAPSEPLPVGALVGAIFEGDYYRARILHWQGDKARVLFIDYGNESECKLADMRCLPAQCQRDPDYAVTIKLQDVPDVSFTIAKSSIEKHVLALTSFSLIYKNDLSKGAILLTKSGQNLNEEVIGIINSKFSVDIDLPTVLNPENFEVKPLPEGNHLLYVFHVDVNVNDSVMAYCGNAVDAKTMHVMGALTKELHDYCQALKMQAYRPRPNELCAAFADNAWNRAYCLRNFDQTRVELYFIDFGNTSILDTVYVRPLKEDFKLWPAIANKCIVKGLKRCNKTQEAALKLISDTLMKVDCEIRATVKRRGDMFEIAVPVLDNVAHEL